MFALWYIGRLGVQYHSVNEQLHISQCKFNEIFIICPDISVTFHKKYGNWSVKNGYVTALDAENHHLANNVAR